MDNQTSNSDFMQILVASLIIGGALYFFGKGHDGILLTGTAKVEPVADKPFSTIEFEEIQPQIFPESMAMYFDNNEYHFDSLTPSEVTRGAGLL